MPGKEQGIDKNAGKSNAVGIAKPKTQAIIVAVVAIAVLAVLATGNLWPLNATGNAAVAQADGTQNTADTVAGDNPIEPEQYLIRERYFEEVFKPKREEYRLFDKAAAYLNKPVEQMPGFFSLNSEGEIFGGLPQVPEDFSEIAYLLANGRYFSIGYLEGEYYKQPEFYPNFKEYGLRYWTQPNTKTWVPHGYGSYPAEQWATLEKGKNTEFTAVVFFYAGWGVQTFQGVTLMPDSKSKQYFDIEITPQNFLLEPSFPKFYDNWAYKIAINGKLKPGTPPGNYVIGINVEKPPTDLKSKWEFDHRNIYFDAAGGIAPAGNQIQLNVTVE